MTDPLRPPETDDYPTPRRRSWFARLACALRSHDNTTTGNVTRCVRCGREWTR